MIAILIIYILSAIGSIIYLFIEKFKKESICRSCHLKQYKRGVCSTYRCMIYGNFERAPEYCRDYCPRKEKEQE